jgi:EAL domain-containing protein (putative c-di-GMP-specific phosphodiesterase class I)/GGDEF domain-containing protein
VYLIKIFFSSLVVIFFAELLLNPHGDRVFLDGADGTEEAGGLAYFMITSVLLSLLMVFFGHSLRAKSIKNKVNPTCSESFLGHVSQKESIVHQVFQSGTDAILILDSEWRKIFTNPAFDTLFDIDLDNGPHETFYKTIEGNIKNEAGVSLRNDGLWEGKLTMITANGTSFLAKVRVSEAGGKADGDKACTVVINSLSHEIQAQKSIDFLTKYDQVTTLPNEYMLREMLAEKVSSQMVLTDTPVLSSGHCVLAIYRLIGISDIMDMYGAAASNIALCDLASDLVGFLGESSVARKGDLDFAIIIHDVFDEEDLKYKLDKISRIMTQERLISGSKTKVQFKAGFSRLTSNTATADGIIGNALVALHDAGQGEIIEYSKHIQDRVDEKEKLRVELVHAVSIMDFKIVYQPQTRIKDHKMIGVEALLRWTREDGTPVSPAIFVPELEKMGAIYDVGLWVLKQCCRQGRDWVYQGLPIFNIAVNVSALQLLNARFSVDVLDIISKSHFPPTLLELELTESSMVRDPDAAEKLMKNLSSIGVKISIDDFGTGYSSLSYLKKFTTLQKLKIDKSFIDSITKGEENVVANAIINLAQSLNLKAIAEGVEHGYQEDYLAKHGCDEIQGYLFSKPLDAEQLVEYVLKKEAQITYNNKESTLGQVA